MQKIDLIHFLQNDEFWLLDTVSRGAVVTADDRLLGSFAEINAFFSVHQREPSDGWDMSEHQLAARLKAFREDSEKIKILQSHDNHSLLPNLHKTPESINEVVAHDDLGLLQTDDDIFTLKHIQSSYDRAETDYVARRKPCPDFEKYRAGFLECHEDINTGKREMSIFFSENDLQEKWYCVLNGMLVYIEKITKEFRDKNGKRDGRLHCIFENGTESTMLLRSLGKALYQNKNGRIVSEPIDISARRLATVTDDDVFAGFIYVVQSRSLDPKIQSIADLYKVGFSTVPVRERLKNAHKEPTYLMAPVHIVMEMECYNMNTQKFENALHTYLGKYCVNLDIFDTEGKRHSPREWFSVNIRTIEQAMDMIIS